MSWFRKSAEQKLALADIRINGDRPWDVQVHDERIYRDVALRGALAVGEGYMNGWWDCQDIAEFTARYMRAYDKADGGIAGLLVDCARRVLNLQTRRRASADVGRHYDIGNDLYQVMLDPRMVYTCARWRNAGNLAQAQEHKLRLTCEKLYLQRGMRVLDIGCGFGSFAKYAAERHGVEVVGITLSEQQVALGRELCKGLPVELLYMDYRDLPTNYAPSSFDRIVSLGMFEHVGPKNYLTYMNTARKLLKEDGLFLLHTIGDGHMDAWMHRYIFRNATPPSMEQLVRALKGLFVVEDWDNFGADYSRTLCAWFENFQAGWDKLKSTGKYDERFYRMWKYYLLAYAGAFRARSVQVWQIVLSPRGAVGGYDSVRI